MSDLSLRSLRGLWPHLVAEKIFECKRHETFGLNLKTN